MAAFDASTGIFWAQCRYDDGQAYRLIGMDTRSGRVAHNLTDPYMAGGMACGGGRCFLIGITRELVRAGTFERVLVELSCTGAGAAAECSVGPPLLRLPTVCIMLGGVMAIDVKTQTVYGVLQNNSATSPCGGESGSESGGGGGTRAAELVRWRPPQATAAGTAVTAAAADAGFKLLGIDFSSKVPVVSGEPILCASINLCPVSITATN